MKDFFRHIKSIPHFYLIRTVESTLFLALLDSSKSPFLDLGCGDGIFGKSLSINNIYGIDIDSSALSRLQLEENYAEANIATASEIPYYDEFFGTVFSNCAVEHMDNIEKVLSEVHRVLLPGGDFIFSVPTPEFLERFKNDKILQSAGLSIDKTIDEYNRIHHHVNIYNLEAWTNLLNSVGLAVEKYCFYLPGEIGEFVTRMDVLYTIQTYDSKRMISKLERAYKGIAGWSFRKNVRKYLMNTACCDSGTHLIIKAKKGKLSD